MCVGVTDGTGVCVQGSNTWSLGVCYTIFNRRKKKSLCMNGLEAAALALNPCSPMCFILKAGNKGNVLIFIKICFQNLF